MRHAAHTGRDSTDKMDAIYVRFCAVSIAAVFAAAFGAAAQMIFKMTVICIESRAAAEVQPQKSSWDTAGKTVVNRK